MTGGLPRAEMPEKYVPPVVLPLIALGGWSSSRKGSCSWASHHPSQERKERPGLPQSLEKTRRVEVEGRLEGALLKLEIAEGRFEGAA